MSEIEEDIEVEVECKIIPFPREYRECAHVVTRPNHNDPGPFHWVCVDCGAVDPHKGDLL